MTRHEIRHRNHAAEYGAKKWRFSRAFHAIGYKKGLRPHVLCLYATGLGRSCIDLEKKERK